jgi:ferric-dicitrate binding protein FerR (iron transport regulator)
MAEQHAVGGGERQHVAGRFFPGQMRRLLHQLARLHPAELRERAIRRLVTPDALRRRKERVAAVTLLVVAVVLIAMDDDFVADFPAPHLWADRPDDA